ncbi:Transcription factor [Penicillium chermesinum]|nr:Transcription factor [Penicillium chermesinum]
MNAGASYTLLGMTERICLTLGLHVESKDLTFPDQALRQRTWWTMAFQNSHFSLAYDRPSITMISQPEIPYRPISMPGNRTYFETICRVVSLSLELLRSRMDQGSSHHPQIREIRGWKLQIQQIRQDAAPHLQHRDHCHSLAQHIERTELRLHSSYLLSVLCRVSLDPHAHLDDHRRAVIREDCIAGLMETVDAFVELHEINSHCSRSWISLQRSIASAFLLVANDDSQQTWSLIDRLEKVLADHVFADGVSEHNSRTDSAKHLSSSLLALREIRDAFRSRKAPPARLRNSPFHRSTCPPRHPSIPTLSLPPNLVTVGGSIALEEWDMRNILGRVSDVMLFPSMSGQNSAV